MKTLFALLALAFSASSFAAEKVVQGTPFFVSESRSGTSIFVQYTPAKPVASKDENSLVAAVRNEVCSHPDVLKGKTVNFTVTFGGMNYDDSVNAAGCTKK